MLQLRVAKDGKLIGTHNDGTVKKAGVGVYEITFNIYVETTRPLVYSDGKITPFLTNLSFDVAAIC